MVNILERVAELMQSDDDNTEKNSDRIVGHYKRADRETREVIDHVFICLCGYSLDSILKGKDGRSKDAE